MLDILPAQLRVKVIRRPRYTSQACDTPITQAPAPPRPNDGSIATEALIAHVLISKFADHLPLYRQVQIFSRQGITLDRSSMYAIDIYWVVAKGDWKVLDDSRIATFMIVVWRIECGTALDSRATLQEFDGGTNAVMCPGC
jgi:hypothetical protein